MPTTTVPIFETTTIEQKAAETEPNLGYNEYNENLNNPNEDETNEIDLTHMTELPTSEISGSATTYRADRSTSAAQIENDSDKEDALSASNRLRSTKILEQQENNSARNMPEMHSESLPWAWAKNILLEKPVMKKTSQK